MFCQATLFGVGGCPGYGKDKVDAGVLKASVTVRPNAGMALTLLKRFWAAGTQVPLQSTSEAAAYPPGSEDRPA